MTDVRGWINGIKRVEPPELWGEVRRRADAPSPPPVRSPRRPLLAAVVLVTSLALLGAVLYGLRDLGTDDVVPLGRPGEIVRYRLEGPPQPLAVGEGAAWVHVGAGDGTTTGLFRIDAQTGERRIVETPGGDWPAVGGGSAWLLCNSSACGGGSVVQLNRATGDIVRTVALPGRGAQIAGTSSGVWVTHETGISFVTSDGVVARTFRGDYDLVGTDGVSLWVSGGAGAMALDPFDGREIAHVAFADVCTMEVAAGMVWVASCDGGLHEGNDGDELLGVDATSGEMLFRRTIEGYGQMRYADGVLWLAQNDPSGLEQIRLMSFDPRTGDQLADPIAIPKGPAQPGGAIIGFGPPHVFFAVGEGSLWLTDFSAFEVIRLGIPEIATPASPDASETPDAPVGRDVGLERRICDVQRMTGDVDGDGSIDTVWLGTVIGRDGRCRAYGHHERVLAIDLNADERADVESRAMDCTTWCVGFAVVDLNGDGIDEILVNEGHMVPPVSAVIGVYELREGRLEPVVFPDGSNRFPLANSWQGYDGAFCSTASTFTTWEGHTDGGGSLRRIVYRTYRLDPSTLTFELIDARVSPARDLPSPTGWDRLCGVSVLPMG